MNYTYYLIFYCLCHQCCCVSGVAQKTLGVAQKSANVALKGASSLSKNTLVRPYVPNHYQKLLKNKELPEASNDQFELPGRDLTQGGALEKKALKQLEHKRHIPFELDHNQFMIKIKNNLAILEKEHPEDFKILKDEAEKRKLSPEELVANNLLPKEIDHLTFYIKRYSPEKKALELDHNQFMTKIKNNLAILEKESPEDFKILKDEAEKRKLSPEKYIKNDLLPHEVGHLIFYMYYKKLHKYFQKIFIRPDTKGQRLGTRSVAKVTSNINERKDRYFWREKIQMSLAGFLGALEFNSIPKLNKNDLKLIKYEGMLHQDMVQIYKDAFKIIESKLPFLDKNRMVGKFIVSKMTEDIIYHEYSSAHKILKNNEDIFKELINIVVDNKLIVEREELLSTMKKETHLKLASHHTRQHFDRKDFDKKVKKLSAEDQEILQNKSINYAEYKGYISPDPVDDYIDGYNIIQYNYQEALFSDNFLSKNMKGMVNLFGNKNFNENINNLIKNIEEKIVLFKKSNITEGEKREIFLKLEKEVENELVDMSKKYNFPLDQIKHFMNIKFQTSLTLLSEVQTLESLKNYVTRNEKLLKHFNSVLYTGLLNFINPVTAPELAPFKEELIKAYSDLDLDKLVKKIDELIENKNKPKE